ncbi:MAG: SbtA family thio(seleno)oxazole RiPP natural product precursor [Syntrophales bacterium]|jgi:radical SAM modification target selenobiotic family peptide
MDKDQFKKFLAGLCMASLISGSALIHSLGDKQDI